MSNKNKKRLKTVLAMLELLENPQKEIDLAKAFIMAFIHSKIIQEDYDAIMEALSSLIYKENAGE